MSSPQISAVGAETKTGADLLGRLDLRTRPEEVTLENWQEAPQHKWGFWHLSEIVPSAVVSRHTGELSSFEKAYDAPTVVDRTIPELEQRLEASHTDAFLVMKHGEVIHEYYRGDYGPSDRHIVMSVSKSLCGLLIGCLVAEKKIDPENLVSSYIPELKQSAYGSASVQQVLDMTVAVKYSEVYEDMTAEVRTQDRVAGWFPRLETDPVNTFDFLTTLALGGKHGEKFQYCSANTDVLAWLIERVTGKRYSDVLSTRLWSSIQPRHDAYITVDTHGLPMANGGFASTAYDLALVGNLVLNKGRAHGRQVVPAEWIDDIRKGGPVSVMEGAPLQKVYENGTYRNQWWVSGDDSGCFYGVGIHGQYLWVDPSTGTVIVKFSSRPEAVTLEANDFHARFFAEVAGAAHIHTFGQVL